MFIIFQDWSDKSRRRSCRPQHLQNQRLLATFFFSEIYSSGRPLVYVSFHIYFFLFISFDKFLIELYQSLFVVTRPKPPYGRQGLAGSWGKDAVWRITLLTRGPNRPPWLKKRYVTNPGPQLTSMIKKRYVTNTGPQLTSMIKKTLRY